MKKPYLEQQVLKKLHIKDFRSLTKDKVIKMATMLDKMDPEVAKKALEQFPEFASTTKEILAQYKETIEKGLTDNSESVKSFYETCNSIVGSLQLELAKEDITIEEKKYIIEKLLLVSEMIGEKDLQNKRFILAMSVINGLAAVATIAILATTLGGTTTAELANDEYLDEEELI